MKTAPFSFWKRLKEIDMFFQKNDPVHKSMRRIVKRLEKAKIPYAIVGGMAVNAHGHHRTTDDLDVLLTAEGLAEFRERFVPKQYETHSRLPRRFTDRTNQVTIDFLVTGLFPGSGKPGPIAYPDPATVRETIDDAQVLDLLNLVQLKLAARRYQDFADVVSLIRVHQLDESFADRLHPSVRSDYIECLEEKRREEEYEARQ
ncbi:MAG TPA: hypothetical protein VH575_11390 [Gemmataceae bacterium]|jgi:hypothetical protein